MIVLLWIVFLMNNTMANNVSCEYWELPPPTGSQVPNPKSQVPSMTWIHTWELFLELRVGSSKKLFPTLNTSPTLYFCINNQDPTLRMIGHILMISWGSKVGALPLCWDLLTWVGLKTPCELALSMQEKDILEHTNAKCDKVTLMVTVLIISVTWHTTQNRISDTILHVTLTLVENYAQKNNAKLKLATDPLTTAICSR